MSDFSKSFVKFHGGDLLQIESDYCVVSNFYKQFLKVNSLTEIEVFSAGSDDKEVYVIPKEFQSLFQIEYASTINFSIGAISFGLMDGVPVIIEQNASPLIFMRAYVSNKN